MPDLLLRLHEEQVLDLLVTADMAVPEAQRQAAEGARWEAQHGMTRYAMRTASNLEVAESRAHMLRAAYLQAVEA